MLGKFPIKVVIAIVFVVAVWWLWPSDEQAQESVASDLASESSGGKSARELVSSIQPISEADAAQESSDESALAAAELELSPEFTKISEAELEKRFSSATQTIKSGRIDQAITQLNGLIADYPQVIEPYINLASLYADDGQFDQSRATLERAMKANPNTATLFQSVQKVYGAQAARAYRLALSDQEGAAQTLPLPELKLPLIESINTREARDNMIDLLRVQVTEAQTRNKDLQSQFAALQLAAKEQDQRAINEQNTQASEQISLLSAEMASSSEMVTQLTQKLEAAEAKSAISQANYDSELSVLRDQLGALSTMNEQLKSREQALLGQVEQQASDIEIARQQAKTAAAADSAATKERERLAVLAAQQVAVQRADEEQTRLALVRQQLDQGQLAQQQKDLEMAAASQKISLSQVAEKLVKSWAKQWSAQNVNGYVSHYQQNYVPPGSGITHAQWLEQRQVRLTNKQFIKVAVREFSVQDRQTQFVVTFTQHYQSNTVDDTIRKRLVFAKQGDDLNNAKIVAEQVVRP